MNFEYSDKVKYLQKKLSAFMDEYIYPNEGTYYEQNHTGERWKVIPVIEDLKPKARAEGLWNLFLPESELGAPATWKCWCAMARRSRNSSGCNRCWKARFDHALR
jgi:acyl-CoA dehydrogenase